MNFFSNRGLFGSRKDKQFPDRVALVLSRNLAHIPFPSSTYFSPIWSGEVQEEVRKVYLPLARKGFSWVGVTSHSKELKLLSWVFPDLLSDSLEKILIYKGNLGTIVNYQDHLSLFVEGWSCSNLEPYWNKLNRWDNLWEKQLEYAYSEQLGYLSSSPSRLGTGLKIYVRLHLPALSFLYGEDKIYQWFKDGDKFRVEVYGEEDQVLAHLFVVSNLFTLGIKETEILKMTQDFVREIQGWEKQARAFLVKSPSHQDIFWQIMESQYKGLMRTYKEQDKKKFLDFVSFWLLAQEEGIMPQSRGFSFMKIHDLWVKIVNDSLSKGQNWKILDFLETELGRIFNDV